jgi:glycosyltransferase involved in cell wall biosynthesis
MISLIATVLNEGASIHRLMRSLAAQTRLPDEVVIVDGGSTDDTVAIIQTYADRLPLRVLVEPGCNISAGRNRAIAAARGDIIAGTDAGVELAPDWLENITRPLLNDPAVQVVGGFFDAQANTPFELAMGATVLPLADEINPATFLPSSRSVAFRKTAWEAVGGYPEWLDYCEDLIFDLRLKKYFSDQSPVASRQQDEKTDISRQLPATSHQQKTEEIVSGEPLTSRIQNSALGTQHSELKPSTSHPAPSTWLVFEPDARVAFRPRGSLRSFFRQYYLYARGDGKADLWRKRHAARYLTYLVAAPVALALGLRIHPLLWLLVIPGAVYYLRQPYRRLSILRRRPEYAALLSRQQAARSTFLFIPVIRVVGDIAKMLGYPVGWAWRLRHRPLDWRDI